MSTISIHEFNAFKSEMLSKINDMENKMGISSVIDTTKLTKKSKAEKKPKPDKKSKIIADTDDPPKKRGTNGYLLFSEHSRKETKQSLIDNGIDAKPKTVLTELGNQWKLLSPEEKDEWNLKAKAKNINHNSSSEDEPTHAE
jgi:hypothetical protein